MVLPGRRKGFGTLPKVRDLQRCMSRGRHNTRNMFIRDVRRSQGAEFLTRVAFWSVRPTGLLRWFCVTGAALGMTWPHFFVAGAVLCNGQIAKPIGTRPSALHSTFHFWRKSRRVASFLVSTWNIEVSQDCFVFDVVKFKNCGGLAE